MLTFHLNVLFDVCCRFVSSLYKLHFQNSSLMKSFFFFFLTTLHFVACNFQSLPNTVYDYGGFNTIKVPGFVQYTFVKAFVTF